MESKTEVDGVSPPAIETLKSIDTASKLDATPVKSVEPITATPSIDTQNNGNDELKSTTNIETVNKTTTTVTVNISQTKVVIDGGDKAQTIEKAVSTFGTIAADTVSAVENVQREAATNSVDVQDVEMVESSDDVEMVDAPEASPAVVPTTSSTEVIETKAVEPDSGTNDVNNEAEQRIDDVEKNISNLFNGEENIVTTNTKAGEAKLDSSVESSAKVDASNENGAATTTATSLSHEATTDNHDLVSILTGTDKADDGSPIISSSEAKTGKAADNEAAADEGKGDVTATAEAPTTSATSSSVVSSEKVDESVADNESGIASKTAKKEIISSHSSTVDVKPTVSGKTEYIQDSDKLFQFLINHFFGHTILFCRK